MKIIGLVVVVILISIGIGLYVAQQDSLTKQTGIAPDPVVSTRSESALSVPDLTALFALLNSEDPNIQEQGIAPIMRNPPSGTPDLLPAKSKVEVKPDTWTVINVDENNEPYVAWIQALVTVPGETAPRHYDFYLIHDDGQWLLYSTSER